jgi:hypothetical protein
MAALSGSGLWAFQCIDLNQDGERGFQRVPSQLHCDWYGTNGQTITVLDERSGFAEKLIAPDDTFQKKFRSMHTLLSDIPKACHRRNPKGR